LTPVEFPPRVGAPAVARRQLATAGLQFRGVRFRAAAVVFPGAVAAAGTGVGYHVGLWRGGLLLLTHPPARTGAVTLGHDRRHTPRAAA
jgi:hypothetical protein